MQNLNFQLKIIYESKKRKKMNMIIQYLKSNQTPQQRMITQLKRRKILLKTFSKTNQNLKLNRVHEKRIGTQLRKRMKTISLMMQILKFNQVHYKKMRHRLNKSK